jgi:hypothetical protein
VSKHWETRLEHGESVERKFQVILQTAGLWVLLPPIRHHTYDMAVSVSGEFNYASDVNLVEVKSKKEWFGSDPASFPFDTVALHALKHDLTLPQRPTFILHSRQTGECVVHPGSAAGNRWNADITDKARGITYQVVYGKRSDLITLEAWIESVKRG